jgi:hypothetical protein
MSDATAPLRDHLHREKERLEKEQPTLAPGYQQFLGTFVEFLRLKRQFEPTPHGEEKHDPALASRLR